MPIRKLALAAMILCSAMTVANTASAVPALPAPAQDEQTVPGSQPGSQTIVLAGGCFWGVEGVYEHVRGVTKAVSGYAGGAAETATYDQVSSGATGHAEAVEVTYDPSVVTLGQLLKVYFSVVADPTTLNYQGPDHGTQYRTAVFATTPAQQRIATTYIAQLDKAKAFDKPIVTQVSVLDKFYPAEAYHQDYLGKHPNNAYIVINDAPKVAALKREFGDLYKD